jgi:hypothetical protein
MSYLGNFPIGGTINAEFLSGDGVTTTYSLSYTYGTEASVLVFIDGVKQSTTNYAVINGDIVFSTAPPSGVNNIELIYVGGRVLTNPYLSADTYGVIRINPNVLTTDTTVTEGYNGSAAGPLTVASGKTLTVANNATLTIF